MLNSKTRVPERCIPCSFSALRASAHCPYILRFPPPPLASSTTAGMDHTPHPTSPISNDHATSISTLKPSLLRFPPFCGLFHVTVHGKKKTPHSSNGQTIPAAATSGWYHLVRSQFGTHSRRYHCPLPVDPFPPPHATLSLEAIRGEVHMAQITDTTGLDDPGTKNSLAKMTWTDGELYEPFEVLITEKADNTTQGKPKTPRRPSRLRPARLRHRLCLLALAPRSTFS